MADAVSGQLKRCDWPKLRDLRGVVLLRRYEDNVRKMERGHGRQRERG
jgi:hypothetical protein